MFDNNLLKNIRYYASYQLLFVVIFVILSSVGAFFHFLLNHEISIVESWLHNNHWEILIFAKLISLFLLNRWFRVRLYDLKSIRELIKELVHFPDSKAIVISGFSLIGYLCLGTITYTGQSLGYWYYHFTSFLGVCLYFGIEFIVIAYLDDVLNQNEKPSMTKLSFFYAAIFLVGFRLSVPDYYGLLIYVFFCFTTLLYLSGKSFKSWSNVLCFLIVFAAPMGSFFGLDPVWGDDFSPFVINSKPTVSFLAVIWMVSFCYYKYRDKFIIATRKLYR